jgi:hypothetical protein
MMDHIVIHPSDEATRDARQDVLGRADFGQLVTAGQVDGCPVVAPTQFLYDADAAVLLHLGRAQPGVAACRPATTRASSCSAGPTSSTTRTRRPAILAVQLDHFEPLDAEAGARLLARTPDGAV